MPRRAAMLMVLYAVTMVAMGLLAYSIAPEGANAKTAIFSSGAAGVLMIGCAVLTLMLTRNRRLGMIGIHVGLILPIVFAMTFFWRGSIGFEASGRYQTALDLVEQASITPGTEIPAALPVSFLSLSEMADRQEALTADRSSRVESIDTRANERREMSDRVIDAAVLERDLELSEPQRALATYFLAPLARSDSLVDHDKAYAGRVLTVLFGISLAFFAAILLQRGKATQEAVPVARAAKVSGTAARTAAREDHDAADDAAADDKPTDDDSASDDGADDAADDEAGADDEPVKTDSAPADDADADDASSAGDESDDEGSRDGESRNVS